MQQTTTTILMVRPINFRMNEQTIINNYYQKSVSAVLPEIIINNAQKEFDAYVKKLRTIGVTVIVVEDTVDPDTPDALFVNNWVSFHANGCVGLYPMFAENRRLERREDILETLEKKGFNISFTVDYTSAEEEGIYLEGTGSIVLDRINRRAYCAISPRADEDLFIEFCEDFEYFPVIFTAKQTVDGIRKAIYHTNVMMTIAEHFAIICLSSIDDKKERKCVVNHLKQDGKAIIEITEKQVAQFAGNMLQVKGFNNTLYLIMSQSAFNCLTKYQITTIKKYCKIVFSNLETIETYGGGSARCMIAEIFLPMA